MMDIKYKGWNSLPVGKYEKIKEIIRTEQENTDIEVLAVLCECGVDDILNMPVSEVMRLKREAAYLNTPLNIKERLKYETIVIDGIKYKVHTNFKDITTAQYLDFQTFYKEFEKNYCNILACFIIPEGHIYNDGYDALETAEVFREKMPVEVAENACFFFAWRSRTSLLKGIRRLILKTAMMELTEKDPQIKESLARTRKLLMQQNNDIDGLAKSMRSLILNG